MIKINKKINKKNYYTVFLFFIILKSPTKLKFEINQNKSNKKTSNPLLPQIKKQIGITKKNSKKNIKSTCMNSILDTNKQQKKLESINTTLSMHSYHLLDTNTNKTDTIFGPMMKSESENDISANSLKTISYHLLDTNNKKNDLNLERENEDKNLKMQQFLHDLDENSENKFQTPNSNCNNIKKTLNPTSFQENQSKNTLLQGINDTNFKEIKKNIESYQNKHKYSHNLNQEIIRNKKLQHPSNDANHSNSAFFDNILGYMRSTNDENSSDCKSTSYSENFLTANTIYNNNTEKNRNPLIGPNHNRDNYNSNEQIYEKNSQLTKQNLYKMNKSILQTVPQNSFSKSLDKSNQNKNNALLFSENLSTSKISEFFTQAQHKQNNSFFPTSLPGFVSIESTTNQAEESQDKLKNKELKSSGSQKQWHSAIHKQKNNITNQSEKSKSKRIQDQLFKPLCLK